MLSELVRKAGLAPVGISDSYAQHCERPLLGHLADLEATLLARGITPQQAAAVASLTRRVLAGCGFVLMGDLSASRTLEYLATLRQGGRALPPWTRTTPPALG
jgi:hypothetical protein